MEIKIQCDCGQRYKLDVEPVNGQMPFTVNCPTCGADGTAKGTALIQQGMAAAEPAAPTPGIITPPTPGKLKLSIGTAAHAPAPAASGEVPAAAPAPLRGMPAPSAASYEAAMKTRKPSFGLGVLGGLIGAVVGAALYYLIVQTTGIRLSYFAIGVGGLSGWLAELMGRREGSKELGGIAATLTVACIIGAQYFVVLHLWNNRVGELEKSLYDASVTEAKAVVRAVPTGSDDEIRKYLAQQAVEDTGNKPDPAAVSADDIKQFHDTVLPGMQDLASGKVTREQFDAQNNIDPVKEKKRMDTDEGNFKGIFILYLIRWSNLISLGIAAGLAFRLCSNA